MTDRNFVLRWARLDLGRNPRHRRILEEERRLAEEHINEIWAEQEAPDAERKWPSGPALPLTPRYAAGRLRHLQ